MTKPLAIIPARSGSKGLPNKNLCILHGIPLVAHTILCALNSRIFSDIIVSTNCRDIAKVSEEFGASIPFLRPQELAADDSKIEDCVVDIIEKLGIVKNMDQVVCLLQPTTPLRSSQSLKDAYKEFLEKNSDSLVSITKGQALRWNSFTLKPNYDPKNRPNRQDYNYPKDNYIENGAIYFTKVRGYMEARSRIHGKVSVYEMNKLESVDIDDQADLTLCEAILSLKH